MNIQEIEQLLIDAGIEPNEARSEVKIMLQDLCNWSLMDMLMGRPIDESKLPEVERVAKLRAETRTPLQHLIGKAYFSGNFYKVTKDVLIPRDETEILVKKALEIIKSNELKDILDIGTGSGCIACTIAQQADTYVLGVDISSEALRIALENASNLNLNNKAVFRKSDIFSKIRDNETFDMIVSNPPYIPIGTELQKEVQFEPSIALFAEDDGLAIYKQIIMDASKYLRKNGYILFECGINQAQILKRILSENGFGNIEIINDLAGIERVICAQLI